MEKLKEITPVEAYHRSCDYIKEHKNRLQLNDFQNRMRQGMNSGWEQKHGDTHLENWQTYAHKLEKALFDLLNSPKGKGGILNG